MLASTQCAQSQKNIHIFLNFLCRPVIKRYVHTQMDFLFRFYFLMLLGALPSHNQCFRLQKLGVFKTPRQTAWCLAPLSYNMFFVNASLTIIDPNFYIFKSRISGFPPILSSYHTAQAHFAPCVRENTTSCAHINLFLPDPFNDPLLSLPVGGPGSAALPQTCPAS